jgi:hypothetical protein
MFWPMEISAGTLSVARMCGVASTLESPSLARACMTTPSAGMEMPVPKRFSAPSIAGPRTPTARASRLAGQAADRRGRGVEAAEDGAVLLVQVVKGAPPW